MPQNIEAIVQRMIDAGESEENIATVIQASTKGDTYTGPDTFMGGFTDSLKQTAADTGKGILRGVMKTFDPRTYIAANQARNAEMKRDSDAILAGRNPNADLPDDYGAGALREMAQNLSTPEGGGETIGGLLTGLLVPKGVGAVRSGMKRGSLRAMQSALKPSESLVKARTGAGFGSKEAIAQAVLDEGRIVSPGSAAKAQGALEATDTAAHDAIARGAGRGVTVDPNRVTAAIDAQNAGLFGKQINAQPDTGAIQSVRDNFVNNPHVSDPVTGMAPMDAELAHEIASNTGKNLKGKFGRLGAATVEAEKAGREAITSDLRQQIPELEPLWQREAQQITTRDAIDQALARRGNTDPIGLGPMIGMVKNPALAGAAMLDRSAMFKSLAAQGLNKGQALIPSWTPAALRAAILARIRSEPPQNP